MKKINAIIISLFVGASIVACGGGNSNSGGGATVQTQPGANWNNSGFVSWKNSNGLESYQFFYQPIGNSNNSLYFLGGSQFSSESAIVQYNSVNNSWTNITYNLPSGNFDNAIYSNGTLFSVISGKLYQLQNKSWSLISGVESGYSIVQLAEQTVNGISNGLAGVLAASNDNPPFQGGNFKVYTLSNNQLIDNTPTPININVSTGYLIQYPQLSIDVNDSTNWALTVGYNDTGVVKFDYYTKTGGITPSGSITSDPSSYYISTNNVLVSNNMFIDVASSAQYPNPRDPSLDIYYLCNTNGCNTVSLPESSQIGIVNTPVPVYNNAILQNGIFTVKTNSIGYQTAESNGDTLLWSCQISGNTVSDCSQVGSIIQPTESFNSQYTTSPIVGLGINNFNINSTNYVNQVSFGGFYNYSYGYYVLDGDTWNALYGSFNNLLSSSDGNYNLYTSCAMNESAPLILDTVSRLGLAKGISLQSASFNSIISSGNVYFGFNGGWYNSKSPGNYVGFVNGNTTITGNSIATPTNGFYSVTLTNSYNLAEVYFNPYPQSCSKVFN